MILMIEREDRDFVFAIGFGLRRINDFNFSRGVGAADALNMSCSIA